MTGDSPRGGGRENTSSALTFRSKEDTAAGLGGGGNGDGAVATVSAARVCFVGVVDEQLDFSSSAGSISSCGSYSSTAVLF